MRNYVAPAPLKARLRARELMHGLFVGMPSPAMVEMIGYAGFDYVIVDMEHGPHSLETLEHMVRAAEASGVAALARLPSSQPTDILRVLETGVAGILVPGIETAAQAREAVGCAYYAPAGRRGISTVTRAARHTLAPDHLRDAARTTTIMLMVEGLGAIRDLEDILALDGLDGIFIGPNDLAAAMGHVGNRDHPEVQAMIDDILARSQRFGRSVATLARAPQDAHTLPPRGFNMITFNATFVLGQALRELRATIEKTP